MADQEITQLRMNRVSYGVRSSAYHSIRSLQETADNDPNSKISNIIKNDFYVDDLLFGAESIQEATVILQEVSNQAMTGGFPLRKWVSSELSVIEGRQKN